MRYWWTNQRAYYKEEVPGGYLWCRQRRADGSRNPFYEAVRLATTGDIIFSYTNARIQAVGVVLAKARAALNPAATGKDDDNIRGWLLDVAWLELKRPLKPVQHMAILAPLLPAKSAPLTPEGRGLQGGRLLELPPLLARALLQLAGGTEPDKLINPEWSPQQLKFSFVTPDVPNNSRNKMIKQQDINTNGIP